MYRVAVIGATGYAGQELVRLLARHPAATLTLATGSQATSAPRRLPALARVWDGEVRPLDLDKCDREADVAFLALPEAASAEVAPALLTAGLRVVDLSGAFRLRTQTRAQRWYPATAAMPDGVAYGLTEFEHEAIRVGTTGVESGLLSDGRAARAAAAGARRTDRAGERRRHRREIGIFRRGQGANRADAFFREPRQRRGLRRVRPSSHAGDGAGAGPPVTFVPHLVPLDRGILSSNYVRLVEGTTGAQVAEAFEQAYASAPFVRLTGSELPEIKHVAWSNFCDIGWKVDEATGRALVVSVIDNLVKGAAGSAVQNFNVMCGIDECAGLTVSVSTWFSGRFLTAVLAGGSQANASMKNSREEPS